MTSYLLTDQHSTFEMINGSKLAFADNTICVLFAYDVQIYTGSRKSRGSEIIRRGIAAFHQVSGD